MKYANLSEAKKKGIAAATLSAVILTCVCIGYIGDLRHFYEMTFLSNFFCGSVLLVAAIRLLTTGKDVPHFLYLDATVLLTVVVGICVSFAPVATLCSPSVTLHLVSPVLMISFYLGYCDARGVHKAIALTTLAMPLAYYVFMIVFGRVTGGYIYIYFDPNSFTPVLLVAFGALAAALILSASLVLMTLSRRIWGKRAEKCAKSIEPEASDA